MRCRSRTLKNWLGLNCCFLLVLAIFFLYRDGRLSRSGYRMLTQQSTNELLSSDLETGAKHPASLNPFIPKIFHHVFATERVYENYKPYINGCLSLNPDWEYYLWTDADAEKLIREKYPKFLSKYKKYTDNLEKSDFIRYILLHHMGGIYLDMDVECVKPFYPALAGIEAFIDQERTEQTSIHFHKPYSAMNSAMGARPAHPFFEHVMEAVLHVNWVGDALRTTGPMVLTTAYESYLKLAGKPPVVMLDPKVFSPLMTKMDEWKKKCQHPLAAARGKPVNSLPLQQKGCILLESKQWRSDDRDNSTIGVHRFLHLGYSWIGGPDRKPLFSVPKAFPGRVKFYGGGNFSKV